MILEEEGVVIGNSYDKYGSKNPVVKLLMKGYKSSLSEMVNLVNPTSIYEVGCGEGYWVSEWLKLGVNACGSDFSNSMIDMARARAKALHLPEEAFYVRNVYHPEPITDRAELVACCEVLEHLERPADALSALACIASPYLIVSVPNEPLWRILNIARGKYLSEWGNTPGHVQHWSEKGIAKLVSDNFEIIKISRPLPWTMLLCKNKKTLG